MLFFPLDTQKGAGSSQMIRVYRLFNLGQRGVNLRWASLYPFLDESPGRTCLGRLSIKIREGGGGGRKVKMGHPLGVDC